MKTLYILPFLLVFNYCFGQGFGYYGKKNTVTLTGNFSPRFIANLNGRSGNYNAPGYAVGYGGTFNFDRQLNANKFIGVEFSINFGSSKLSGTSEMSYYYAGSGYGAISKISNVSPIGYRVLSPCFTFSTTRKGHIAPIGIVHTIGFGALILKTQDDPIDYTQSMDVYDETVGVLSDPSSIIFDKNINGVNMYGARVFWQTSLNVPLAKGVMWTVAARANLNLYSQMVIHSGGSSNYFHFDIDKTKKMIAMTELLNVLQINTGFKFAF